VFAVGIYHRSFGPESNVFSYNTARNPSHSIQTCRKHQITYSASFTVLLYYCEFTVIEMTSRLQDCHGIGPYVTRTSISTFCEQRHAALQLS